MVRLLNQELFKFTNFSLYGESFFILVETKNQLIMDQTTYHNLKGLFFNLTGKRAEDDLTAFFSYVNMLNLLDIKDRMNDLRNRIINIENNSNRI